MSEKNYDVGYRKPPIHSRFKKGQSGNPKGRPKGKVKIEDVDAALDQVLSALISVNENGQPRKISKLKALLTQTVNKGIKGHHASTSLVLAQLARRVGRLESDASASGKTDEEAKSEFLATFNEMQANLLAVKTTAEAPDDPPDGKPQPGHEDGASPSRPANE